MTGPRKTLALLAALVLAAPALAETQREHGKEVFDKWCAPCHAPGPNHPGTQALDYKYQGKEPGPLEQRRDLTPDVTRTFVRGGVSIMPPFRKTEIDDKDLDALAAYLAHPHDAGASKD